MAILHCKRASRTLCSFFVAGLMYSLTSLPAAAQDTTAEKILNTLAPPVVTRGLSSTPQQPSISDADRTFIDGLRHRTRSLSLDESDHVAELAKNAAKIDLTVYFDYNSAVVTDKAKPILNEIGKALSDARLGGSVMVIAGHTDARGSEEYNQKLSERRAEAVKKYIVDELKVPSDNLSTAGYGKRDLKNPAKPFAAENRRVQIVNLSSLNQANR